MVINFLNRGALARDPRVEWRTVNLGREMSVPQIPEAMWLPHEIVIDGTARTFKRATLDDHWIALAEIDDADVAIEGHRLDPDPLELVRLDRPAA